LDDWCADPESSQSWLKIDSSSSLHLTHFSQGAASYEALNSWPMPFAASSNLSDVLFSLPASPSDNEYTAAMQLSSYLGASNDGDNYRPAALLGEPGEFDQAKYHMIVIGRPTRNPVLQAVNPKLPQPFTPGTDGIQQEVDNIVFRLPENLDLGYLQSLISPWDEEHILLVITGTSDSGVQRAASLLVDPARNWEIKGNLALLRDSEVLTTDTRQLTSSGQLTAVATSLPEATMIGTATAMPPSALTPTAIGGDETSSLPPSYPQRFPFLLPLIITVGIVTALAVLAMVYWRSRRHDVDE
jgi:hypothetical protein